jgi:hypothetical protein
MGVILKSVTQGWDLRVTGKMQHLTDQILANAVATIIARQNRLDFDTHELIRVIMRLNPKEYVAELYLWVHTDDPIIVAHSQIGIALANHSVPGIKSAGRHASLNVRGENTQCEIWERI